MLKLNSISWLHVCYLCIATFSLFSLISCHENSTPTSIDTNPRLQINIDQLKNQLIQLPQTGEEYLKPVSRIINNYFEQALTSSETLQQTINSLSTNLTQENLELSQKALNNAHLMFASGLALDQCIKIFSTELNDDLSITQTLDQYPILPGYLDSVEDYPFSGLIHSDIPLLRTSLIAEFQLGDPLYVTLGFHPLGIILNGSNNNRNLADFSELSETIEANSASPELRRTLYAKLLSEEILSDLSRLTYDWINTIQPSLLKMKREESEILMNRLNNCATKGLNENKPTDHISNDALQKSNEWLNQIIKLGIYNTQPGNV